MIVKAFGTIAGDVIGLDRPLAPPNASRMEVTISTLEAAAYQGQGLARSIS